MYTLYTGLEQCWRELNTDFNSI